MADKRSIGVVPAELCLLDSCRNGALTAMQASYLPGQSYRGLITNSRDRPGSDLHHPIDANKIQRDHEWTPQKTFESGINKTVVLYLENL